jgi:zinc finger protein
MMSAEESFTLILDDPAGNSFVENLCAPRPDPQMLVTQYSRTDAQNEMLGLALAQEPTPEISMEDELAFKEQVHVFGGNCSRCNYPCETKMHMLGILMLKLIILDIPHFKDVIIMATSCESCGYKSNEVKSGGAIAEKGKKISCKITELEDLSRIYFLIYVRGYSEK